VRGRASVRLEATFRATTQARDRVLAHYPDATVPANGQALCRRWRQLARDSQSNNAEDIAWGGRTETIGFVLLFVPLLQMVLLQSR
jgi:hypothetical protein